MPVSPGALLPTSSGSRVPVKVAVPDIVAEESYLVRNEHKAPTCYTHGSPVNGELYRWAGKGDPEANDVLAIPGYVVRSPQFQRALMKHLFTLVMEGEENPLALAGQIWEDQQTDQQAEVMAQLEREQDLELHDVKCQGPGPKGAGRQCGEQLFIRGVDMENRPPLCDRHLEKYAKFFIREDGEWKRIAGPQGPPPSQPEGS